MGIDDGRYQSHHFEQGLQYPVFRGSIVDDPHHSPEPSLRPPNPGYVILGEPV